MQTKIRKDHDALLVCHNEVAEKVSAQEKVLENRSGRIATLEAKYNALSHLVETMDRDATNVIKELQSHILVLTQEIQELKKVKAGEELTEENKIALKKLPSCDFCGGYHVEACRKVKHIIKDKATDKTLEVEFFQIWDESTTIYSDRLEEEVEESQN